VGKRKSEVIKVKAGEREAIGPSLAEESINDTQLTLVSS